MTGHILYVAIADSPIRPPDTTQSTPLALMCAPLSSQRVGRKPAADPCWHRQCMTECSVLSRVARAAPPPAVPPPATPMARAPIESKTSHKPLINLHDLASLITGSRPPPPAPRFTCTRGTTQLGRLYSRRKASRAASALSGSSR